MGNDKVSRLQEIFGLLAEVERGAARTYRVFYDRFREGDVGAFWFKTAIEEDEHAIYFENNRKLVSIVPDAFGDVKCSTDEIREILAAIKKLEAEAASYKTDLKRALEIAYTIEATLREAEFVNLIDIKAASLKRKYDFILHETSLHKSEIEGLVKRYGAD